MTKSEKQSDKRESAARPTLSVVIPVYNAEEYLEACLDTLVSQTLGASRLEIICVNDASTDGSVGIIRKFQDAYSGEFKVLENKTNVGPGKSRNKGLKAANGEFVSFVDADDFVDVEAFSHLTSNMIKTSSPIAVYNLEANSLAGVKYRRNFAADLWRTNGVIEKFEYAANTEIGDILGANNMVFSKKILEEGPGFSSARSYESAVMVQTAISMSERIYFSDRVTYYYRRNDAIDPKEEFYLHNFIDPDNEGLIRMSEGLLELSSKTPQFSFILNWSIMRVWLPHINTYFKEGDKAFLDSAKRIFSALDPGNSFRGIDSGHSLLKEAIMSAESAESLRSSLRRAELRQKMKRRLRSGLSLAKRIVVALLLKGWIIKIVQIARSYAMTYVDFFRLKKEASELLYSHDGRLWLIGERGDEAKDNGFALFAYIRKNHPDIPAFYLISKDNKADFERASRLGNVIELGTRHHKLYFLASTHIICTHARSNLEAWRYPQDILNNPLLKSNYKKKKYVFLQHGITMNNVKSVIGKNALYGNFDMFVAGARPEYEYMRDTFDYTGNEIKYTGFSRFDNLSGDKPKRQILFMPSWRQYLVQSQRTLRTSGRTVKDTVFLRSEYFNVFNSLLSSPRLASLLEENNVDLIFYPHFEIQQYLKYFNASSSNVKLAGKDDYTVQGLLKESAFLITDYSSVFFDFAYMGKPVMHYQFDESHFFGKHYVRGYFNFKRGGFGPVKFEEDGAIDYIEKQIASNFKMEKKYEKRVDAFFELKDTDNSQRIVEAIEKL